MQPHPDSIAALGRRGPPPPHPTSTSLAPGVHMQPEMFPGQAHPSQQSAGGIGMHVEEADALGGGPQGSSGRLDGPPAWQHSGGDGGAGGHMLGAGGSTGYNARQTARMLQQITMPPGGGGYSGGAPAGVPSGAQMMYGVPTQPNGSFNAMYIGVQPAYVEAHGGVAAAAAPVGVYPQQEQMFVGVRGGPTAGVLPAPPTGMAGQAVHEGTQRGGTALRKLQNVPEGAAARPVMLRAAPTGRTAARRHGAVCVSAAVAAGRPPIAASLHATRAMAGVLFVLCSPAENSPGAKPG